jgi:uncharacterized protein involved in outer membrane biogenesis
MKALFRYTRKIALLTLALAILTVLSAPILIPALVRTEWAKAKVKSILSEKLGRTVHAKGELELEFDLTPKLTITEFIIENPPGLSRREMLTVGTLSVSCPLLSILSRSFEISEIESRDVTLHVARDDKTRLNWDFSGDAPHEETKDTDINQLPIIHRIALNDISLLIELGERPHEISFQDILAKDINLQRAGSFTSSLEVDGAPISLEGKLSSLNRFLKGDALEFNVNLQQEANHLAANGKFHHKGQTHISVKASGEDLSELSAITLMHLPPWKNYSFETKVTSYSISQSKFEFNDLKLHLGESDLNGKVSLSLAPLSVSAKLQSQNFDLGALSEHSASTHAETGKEKKPPHIPYEIFEAVNADIEFKAANLKTFLDVQLQDADFIASIKNGHLVVPQFIAKVFGGSIAGTAEARDRVVSWKLRGEHLDANPITMLAGAAPILEGNFNLAIDLVGKGEDLSDILKTLSGTIMLNSDNARVKNSTLHAISSGLAEILSPLFENMDQASSECILFNYEVKDGVAASKEQVIKLDEVFIFPEGKINFSKNELTYNFNAHSTNPALASLIPPFRAFGKLNNLHFVPSISGSVASVADSGEEVVEAVFDIVQEAGELVVGDKERKLTGLAVCKAAYAAEQNRVSSRVGNLLDGNRTTKKMHPSWDADGDGINDCERDDSCDHTFDYSKPR